jgi:hypothetical protein
LVQSYNGILLPAIALFMFDKRNGRFAIVHNVEYFRFVYYTCIIVYGTPSDMLSKRLLVKFDVATTWLPHVVFVYITQGKRLVVPKILLGATELGESRVNLG